MIQEYIQNQLEEDLTSDQISQGVYGPVYRQQEEVGKGKQPLLTASCSSDAMTNIQSPFRGQQVLPLIGSEQTTSLLVVMIIFSRNRQEAEMSLDRQIEL